MTDPATNTILTKQSNPLQKKGLNNGVKMFLMILPFMILVILFCYLPLYGWIYAFFDYKPPLSLSQAPYVGFKWFTTLFSNATQLSQLSQVMINTFAMSGIGIATSFLPLFFAIFLNEIKVSKFKKSVQTLTTIPNFISWVLVYSVAFSLFSDSGFINTILKELHLTDKSIQFLISDRHVYLTMWLWNTWKGLGWGAIMYLAAIAGIDQELYEAARVDGAGRFRLMRHVTIPQLMPTFIVLLMLSIASFINNGMDQYFIFQNSFNKQYIQVLDLYVYNIGITGNSIPLATAVGMMKSVVSVSLLILVNFISKKTRGQTII